MQRPRSFVFALGMSALGTGCTTPEVLVSEGETEGGIVSLGGESGDTGGFDDEGGADQGDDVDTGAGDGDGDDSCASVSETADFVEVPADIIFVVDNSGSMSEEAAFVQAEMNGFSAQIEASGIDHHVVLISSYPDEGNGICIDPPLGAGGCPGADDNLPVYRHVDEKVGSHDALELLLDTHDQWQGSIRANSVKHVIVVSDDESELGADDFDQAFRALDPSYDPYQLHAIVCPWMCPEAAEIGQTYLDLLAQTNGVLGDLCAQDFQTVFDELADAVIAGVPLSCEFDIPAPPEGMTLDPDLVNVELDDGAGGLEVIPRVDAPVDCVSVPEGWYYDDPLAPQQISLCPQTCSKAQSYEMGAVNVQFGCSTFTPE